jgi:predicted membrane metal-binding protein
MTQKYLACVLILALGFVLCIPCAALAQSNKSAWENLNTLQAGHKIEVVEMNSKKVSGAFVSVTDAGISLQVEGGEQTIARQDVRVVKLMENKHRLRNAAVGAAIGAGAGAGAGAAVGRGNGNSGGFDFAAQGAGIGAGAGAVIGAIVGALLPCHDTVYRAAGR